MHPPHPSYSTQSFLLPEASPTSLGSQALLPWGYPGFSPMGFAPMLWIRHVAMDSLRDSGYIPSKALIKHSRDGAPVTHMGVTQGVMGPGLSLTCLRAQAAGTRLVGGYCCKLYYSVF